MFVFHLLSTIKSSHSAPLNQQQQCYPAYILLHQYEH